MRAMTAVLELTLKGAIGEGKPISLSSVRNRLAVESFSAVQGSRNPDASVSGEEVYIG